MLPRRRQQIPFGRATKSSTSDDLEGQQVTADAQSRILFSVCVREHRQKGGERLHRRKVQCKAVQRS